MDIGRLSLRAKENQNTRFSLSHVKVQLDQDWNAFGTVVWRTSATLTQCPLWDRKGLVFRTLNMCLSKELSCLEKHWRMLPSCQLPCYSVQITYNSPNQFYLLLFLYLASNLWTTSRVCCSRDPIWCFCFIWINIFSEVFKSGCIFWNWENKSAFMIRVEYVYVDPYNTCLVLCK